MKPRHSKKEENQPGDVCLLTTGGLISVRHRVPLPCGRLVHDPTANAPSCTAPDTPPFSVLGKRCSTISPRAGNRNYCTRGQSQVSVVQAGYGYQIPRAPLKLSGQGSFDKSRLTDLQPETEQNTLWK